jgi:RNA polymerase sigma-70 factor (ECF subfamily)
VLDENAAAAIEDPADNPEVVAQFNDRSAIVRKCLKQLSPAHQEIIDLVYYHEKSIAEISEIIRAPQNTVKTRMFYARKKMTGLLNAEGIDRVWS